MCGQLPELSFYFIHQCRMLLQVSSKFFISRIKKTLHYRILQSISELRLKGGVILAQQQALLRAKIIDGADDNDQMFVFLS